MARICRNLAKETNNFERADKNLAYWVYFLERETGITIKKDFPAMKFYNLLDQENGERYKNGGTTGKTIKNLTIR